MADSRQATRRDVPVDAAHHREVPAVGHLRGGETYAGVASSGRREGILRRVAHTWRPQDIGHHRRKPGGIQPEAGANTRLTEGPGARVGRDDQPAEYLHRVPRWGIHGRAQHPPAGRQHVPPEPMEIMADAISAVVGIEVVSEGGANRLSMLVGGLRIDLTGLRSTAESIGSRPSCRRTSCPWPL